MVELSRRLLAADAAEHAGDLGHDLIGGGPQYLVRQRLAVEFGEVNRRPGRDFASENVRRVFDASGPYRDVMRHANVPPSFVVVQRINLGLFFQTTAIFLFVFVVQLLISGIHESSEQRYFGSLSGAIHDATEAWGPDSAFGHLLTYLLVILPVAWLLVRGLTSSFKAPKSVPQHSSAR